MKNAIRNLIFLSFLLFSISYDSCTAGVVYDEKFKLYPAYDEYSCTLATYYGQRWQRLGFVTFSIGTSLTLAAFIVWRRQKQKVDLQQSLSILVKEG